MPVPRPTNEPALLLAVRQAKPGATETLYRLLSPAVRGVVCRVARDSADEYDDLVQIAFERIVRSLVDGRFKGDCSLQRWAMSIALNTALDHQRQRARERRIVERKPPTPHPAAEPSIDGERLQAARSEVAQLATILASMKPLDVQALLLHDGWGYTVREVAAAMHRSEVATGSRLIRARKDLLRRVAKLSANESSADSSRSCVAR